MIRITELRTAVCTARPTPSAPPFAFKPAAQLTLAMQDWTVGAFSTNLTNQHYVAAINGARRLAGAPRQYGLRVSRSF